MFEGVALGWSQVAAVPNINSGREQRGAAAGGYERAGGQQEQQKLIRSDNPSVRTVHRFSFAIVPSTKSFAREYVDEVAEDTGADDRLQVRVKLAR
jgi:hypothetical protein